ATSLACAAVSIPLVSAPASMASVSSTTNALVRCLGVSPPWQPMTRSSTARSAFPAELLRHLEELEEVLQAAHVGDDDRARVLGDEAQAAEARHHLVRDVDVDVDLLGE